MASLTDFLGSAVFASAPAALADLARLEGRQIDELRLFATIEECAGQLYEHVPLYVLPVGEAAGFPVGLHLRPEDVAAGRLAFVSIQGPGQLIEIASSPRHLAALSLLRVEGFSQETGETDELDDAVAAAAAAFGEDFFAPGRNGRFRSDEAESVAVRRFGPTPSSCTEALLFADDRQERRRIMHEGRAAEPRCMELHMRAALDADLGDAERAAAAALALSCHHHTAFETRLPRFYAAGRALLERVPEAFSETARRDLATADDQERMRWAADEGQRGDLALAVKLLADMCHQRNDYQSALPSIREHFEGLGWHWALALCELRAAAA